MYWLYIISGLGVLWCVICGIYEYKNNIEFKNMILNIKEKNRSIYFDIKMKIRKRLLIYKINNNYIRW